MTIDELIAQLIIEREHFGGHQKVVVEASDEDLENEAITHASFDGTQVVLYIQ